MMLLTSSRRTRRSWAVSDLETSGEEMVESSGWTMSGLESTSGVTVEVNCLLYWDWREEGEVTKTREEALAEWSVMYGKALSVRRLRVCEESAVMEVAGCSTGNPPTLSLERRVVAGGREESARETES